MDIDKQIIKSTGIFCIISFPLSLLLNYLQVSNFVSIYLRVPQESLLAYSSWITFATNLFLGLFCNGTLIIAVSIISNIYKFKKCVNNMLFYSRNAKTYYDRLPYSNTNKYISIFSSILEAYQKCYSNYSEIEYIFITKKYKNAIRDLFTTFSAFVCRFNSAIIENEVQEIDEKRLSFYFNESQSFSKLDMHEFIYKYADLYSIWDNRLFAEVIENESFVDSKHNKHETIRQILAKRKLAV
jgi:hypothetical protein